MSDVIPWRFVVFAIVFAGLLYLQFYLAHRQWKKLRGEPTSEIDVSYVRMEDYLAQSFRMKVKEWLQLPSTAGDGSERTIIKGRERIRVTGELAFGSGEQSDDIHVVEKDFSCGSGCVFAREILVRGNARIGDGSELQSMAVDGELSLGSDVKVARWLDSARELRIGSNCLIGARVTSLGQVHLGLGAQAGSMYAPQVVTEGWDGTFPGSATPEAAELPEIKDAGLDPKKLTRLSSDCWLYNGDFRPAYAVRLKDKLVVKGNCSLPEGCILEADIRADGSLHLGPNCLCKGNLIAGGDIHVGPGSRFSGVIHAGRSLQLGRGTRGFKEDGMVVAYAEGILKVEGDVAIKGKLSAGGRVIVESPEDIESARG